MWWEVNFEVGDLVLAYLRKERFPRGQYNKLKHKKIGPCKILWKFSTNSYELELPIGIGISPIFNIADLYPYTVDDIGQSGEDNNPTEPKKVNWLKQMPTTRPIEAKAILETKIAKKTRGKEYLEYLVKWQGHPEEDSTWMSATNLKKKGYIMEDLMSRSSWNFWPLGGWCRSIELADSMNLEDTLLIFMIRYIATRVGSWKLGR